MKIATVYFSPTGSTAKIARVVRETFVELKVTVDDHDITSHSSRKGIINFEEYDLIFFGFPIHVQRAPRIIREWLQTLDGKNLACSVFFTYGGVTTGVAHYDIKKRLEKQNFRLVSTSEFLAKHTFNAAGWKLMENRPEEKDFLIAKEYAQKTLEKLNTKDFQTIDFEEPAISEAKLDRADRTSTRGVKPPSREGQECSMCLKCEIDCPSNAMDANVGQANKDRCLRCMRCHVNCLDNALKIMDMTPAYTMILNRANTPVILENKVSKYFM